MSLSTATAAAELSAIRLDYSVLRSIFDGYSSQEKEEFLRLMNVTSVADLQHLVNASPDDDVRIKSDNNKVIEVYYEYQLHKQLLLYVPPIVFFLGILGNMISFFVLNCRTMRRLSTCAYLSVLSLADTTVLIVGLLRLWIAELTGTDLRDLSGWSCKLINTFGSSVSDFSVWLIIAVTVERFVIVWYPLKVASLCRRTRANWIMAVLLAVIVAINSHFFWTVELTYSSSGTTSVSVVTDEYIATAHCEPAEQYRSVIYEIWPWMDAFIYSFFPFASILSVNILIVMRLFSTRRNRTGLFDGGLSNPNMSPSTSRTTSSRSCSSAAENSAKISIMLLTVSFAFVATTLPMNVTLIVSAFCGSFTRDRRLAARIKLTRTVCELLMYANHATNFFLYCTTGNKFRNELWAIFSRRETKTSVNNSRVSENNYGVGNLRRRPRVSTF